MTVAQARVMAGNTGTDGEGWWEALGSAFGFVFPFTQSTRDSGSLEFPWHCWWSPRRVVIWPFFLRAPSLPCPGLQPLPSRASPAPVTLLLPPPLRLCLGSPSTLLSCASVLQSLGLSTWRPTGQMLTHLPRVRLVMREGPGSPSWQEWKCPWAPLVMEKYPQQLVRGQPLSWESFPPIQPVAGRSRQTCRLYYSGPGCSDGRGLERCVEQGSEAASGLPARSIIID